MNDRRTDRVRTRCAIRALVWALAGLWLAVTLVPLVWVGLTSLKTPAEYSASPLGLPPSPTVANFARVGAESSFGRFYVNGLVVTVVAVVVTTVASALAGYALARVRFRGAGVLLALFLLGLVVPIHATLVPLHRMESVLGLRDTLLGLIFPYVGFSLPVGVMIFRGFFLGLPREVEEAAAMDGAGRLRIIFEIALPLARPAAATVVIFTSVTLWNEYAFALTLLSNPAHFTVPLGLDSFGDAYAADVPLTCAAIAMALGPILGIYLLAERHITKGLAAGAIR